MKRFLLKLKYGKRLKLFHSVEFHKGSKITIQRIGDGRIRFGQSCRIGYNTHIVSFSGGIIDIGDSCFFNKNCYMVAGCKIKIGNSVSFGPNVCVFDHDHEFDRNKVYGNKYKKSEIVIEDNCWIASNVVILRNTHIGKGSIIGAGTVVKGEIPAHSIVTSTRTLNIKEIH